MHPHTSVLIQEVLAIFNQSQLHYFVDATLGAGGHAEAILQHHPEIKKLIGIDQDPVAREIAQKRLAPWKDRVTIIPGNFREIEQHLDTCHIDFADGMLFDLGVSSMQFDLPEKGFSFMRDGPLDMRMDPSQELTAADIINHYSEAELGKIFREYGEEKRWRIAAKAIVEARKHHPILTTFQLKAALSQVLHPVKKGLNPLTLIFQGLRICVNGELEALENVLPAAVKRLAAGGRLGIISFHSLEDRIVKNFIRFSASDKVHTTGIGGLFLDKEPEVDILTKKPITATIEEVTANPRSRSAKLRALQKR